MLAYNRRKAREERDELAEKNKEQAAEIRKLKRELNKAKKIQVITLNFMCFLVDMTNKNISILLNRIVYSIISNMR